MKIPETSGPGTGKSRSILGALAAGIGALLLAAASALGYEVPAEYQGSLELAKYGIASLIAAFGIRHAGARGR